jgi:hypothetical protein
MENIWLLFKEKYEGEQATREAFNLLCLDLLERHFPGKDIVSANQISDKITQEKSWVIYQPKYFLDDLSNSRKGQVRKAFNDSIIVHNPKKHPLFAWVLCVPLIFNEEEGLWWLSWSGKMIEEYQINIQLFDGEFMLELLHKYNLFDKWFGLEKVELKGNIETNIPENELNDGLFEFDESDIISTKYEKNDDIEFVIERKKAEEFTEDEIVVISEEVKNPTKIIESEKSDEKIEIGKGSKEKLMSFKKLKNHHKEISAQNNTLDELQKDELESLFKKNKVQKDRFDFEDFETDEFTTPDLVFKARQFKINENYEKALYIYEKITERSDLKEETLDEVKTSIELCEKMIAYRNKIYEGDFYFVKKDYLTALQSYEVAFQIDNTRKEIIKKYNFTFAEALIEQKIYKLALDKYDEALKAEPNSKLLQDKRAFAQLMFTGNKVFKKAPASYLNPLLAPWFYRQAWKIDSSNLDLNLKLKKARTNSIYTLISLIGISIIVVLILSIPPIKKEIILADASKAMSMYDYQMQSGDFYLNNYTEEKVHYIDSAIYSYQNAIKYKPHDSLAPSKLETSKTIKAEYITRVQELILLDSAAYFVSMRDPSEGLRLFKYLFEPYNKSKGKFGYVDEEMNVVIPPVFDFNYKNMYNSGERFQDGKAYVCLEISPGDTLYFYIDKNSNRVE